MLALTDLTLCRAVSCRTSARVQVKGSSCLPAFVCEDVSRVCVECCVLEKVGAGRPCICYSPCFVHSANAELFKGIHMLKAD